MQNYVSGRIFSNEAARQIQNIFLAECKMSALAITETCLGVPTLAYTFHTAKDVNYNRARLYQMPFCTRAG